MFKLKKSKLGPKIGLFIRREKPYLDYTIFILSKKVLKTKW